MSAPKPATTPVTNTAQFAPPSPRSGVRLPIAPGSHGGGKPGRSGRKPAAFLEICKASAIDPDLHDQARAESPLGYLKTVASYDIGLPKATVAHEGEVVVRVVYDAD